MARHRTHPIAFKRQIAQEFLSGEVSLQGLAKRNDICRNLIRVWVEKYERGEFDDEVEAANLLEQYEARIAALERMVGRLALENELLKGASRTSRPPRDGRPSVIIGPVPFSVAEGCRVMEVARSSFYDAPSADPVDDTALVERMYAIQGDFPAYGYRRITAQIRADGVPVNRKRVARLMRLHCLQVRPRRRYVATTDSDHDSPIFPNLSKDIVPDGPDQLWVADITDIAIATGFVYLAVILDPGRAGWSATHWAAPSRPG